MLHFSYCIESHSSPMSARPTTSPSVFLEGQNDSREASKDLFTKNLVLLSTLSSSNPDEGLSQKLRLFYYTSTC